MAKLPSRNEIKEGLQVGVEIKKNQGTGRLTTGTVQEILTASKYHPHGIKVRLEDGHVGRVKKIFDHTMEEQTHSLTNLNAQPMSRTMLARRESVSKTTFTNLDEQPIPKTEDKYNEFKEFYQYDKRIGRLPSMGTVEYKKAIGIMSSVRERFATAVCAFGNDSSGGFVHLGIRADGTVIGLERDKQIGNFVDYKDSFANHIRDTLGTFLRDKIFIIKNIQIVFRHINGKTICTIQILPADRPLYLHVDKEQRFYVRGPTPRAERLTDQQELFRYIKSRFPNDG